MIHFIKLFTELLQGAVPDRERQEDPSELRLVLVEGTETVVQALAPDAGPAPLTEGAKTRVADVSGLEVDLGAQLGMKQYVGLDRVGAICDAPPDVSRTCVEHQISADRVVELAMKAELPKYAIIGVRGSLPRHGVAAPWHRD